MHETGILDKKKPLGNPRGGNVRRSRERMAHEPVVVENVRVELEHPEVLGRFVGVEPRTMVLRGLVRVIVPNVNLGVSEDATFGPDNLGVLGHQPLRLELLEHTFFGVEAVPDGSREESERNCDNHGSDDQLNQRETSLGIHFFLLVKNGF